MHPPAPTVPRVERYVIRGGQPGAERLAVLARTWLPTTSALLDRVQLAPGMRCLDLGCGGGDVTLELARRVGPTGRVTGVDMDDVKLSIARASADEAGLATVELRHLNVYDWTEPDAYDLVYCRYVLQHLSRPVDVLRAMWAGVRPGGVVVVEDADFEGSFCDPPHAGFAFWVDAYQRVLRRHGGDPLTGRKLPRLFAEAGIDEPELTVVQRADRRGEAKTLPFSTIEATAEAIVAEGIATQRQVDDALEDLRIFADDDAWLSGSPRIFQAWTRRGR